MKIFLIDLFFICVVAFVLKVSIAQAYNIIFMYLKRPYLWLLIVILLAIINMIISTFFNQGINIFSYAVILTVFNLNSEKFKSKELQKVVRDTTDEIYLALGIENGRVLYQAGVWGFAIVSFITYLICYALIR
jgi:hypothetical protein